MAEVLGREAEVEAELDKNIFRQSCWYSKCAGNREDKTSIKVLVNISKVLDEVVIAEKTKSQVDQAEEKKESRDNLFFCNK